jgi:hypothetical protein
VLVFGEGDGDPTRNGEGGGISLEASHHWAAESFGRHVVIISTVILHTEYTKRRVNDSTAHG